jgi:transposase
MNVHTRANTTPESREFLIRRVWAEGWSRRKAAEAFGLSLRTAAKWLRRFRQEGAVGLRDRSSRPHSSPQQTPEILRRKVLELRQKPLTGLEITQTIGLPRATVSRIL